MKYKYLTYIALAFAGALTTTGCTDDFANVNQDPTAFSPANYNPNYLLTASQLTYTGSTDNAYETWRGNLIYSSTMMQQLSTVIGYWAGDKYMLNAAYTSAYWDKAYPDQIKAVVELVEFTRGKAQYSNLHQVSRIMRALILQRVTDLYGDIPYFDAGMGNYSKVFFPKYDKQDVIYADLLKEIEEATAQLESVVAPLEAASQSTKDASIIGDLIYGGDLKKWTIFGNSLLLRTAMRLTKVSPETAKSYVQKVAGKTMRSNDDNAILKHDASGSLTTQNRNSIVLLKGPENMNVKLSKTFVDFLKTNNDPRLAIIAITKPTYDPAGNATGGDATVAVQKGMPNGYDLGGTNDISKAPGYTTIADYSSLSPSLLSLSGPTFILTYAETELLLADAAARWNVGGSAEDHYKKGVKAGITYFAQYPNVSNLDAAADAYLTAHPYDAAKGLEMINTQFWVATLLNGYEAWNNWRRTGFPVLTPVDYKGNATNGQIPRRFPYPISEANNNPANYTEAHNAVTGGDFLTGRVWWDKE